MARHNPDADAISIQRNGVEGLDAARKTFDKLVILRDNIHRRGLEWLSQFKPDINLKNKIVFIDYATSVDGVRYCNAVVYPGREEIPIPIEIISAANVANMNFKVLEDKTAQEKKDKKTQEQKLEKINKLRSMIDREGFTVEEVMALMREEPSNE